MKNIFFCLLLTISSNVIFSLHVAAQILSDELNNGTPLSLHVGVSGQVKEVMVAVGDQVQLGQVLVTLNTQHLSSKLNAAYAQHKAVKTKSTLVVEDYERQQELYEEGSLSTVELQNYELSVFQAKAQVAAVRAQISALKQKLENAKIVAPVAGEILAVPFVGQWANMETGMTRLIKLRVK